MSTIRLREFLVSLSLDALRGLLDEAPDLVRRAEATSLFEALEHKVDDLRPARLARMSRLPRQRGAVLEGRRELPEEAFVPASELRQVFLRADRGASQNTGSRKVAPIIAISFCWGTPERPDPEGKQLNLAIDALGGQRDKCARCGFLEMGAFWDWTSLLQGDLVKQ